MRGLCELVVGFAGSFGFWFVGIIFLFLFSGFHRAKRGVVVLGIASHSVVLKPNRAHAYFVV